MTLNDRVRAAYEKSGLTYKALSKLTGLKQNSLSCWINGQRTPPDYVVALIEEKVNNYISNGREYIDKAQYRDLFLEELYSIWGKSSQRMSPQIVIKIFDKLPTVSFKKEGD